MLKAISKLTQPWLLSKFWLEVAEATSVASAQLSFFSAFFVAFSLQRMR